MRFWLAKTCLRIAMWADPNTVRNAMGSVFIEQMHREGIVGIEFGFNDEGDPTMLVRRISDLPVVTKH